MATTFTSPLVRRALISTLAVASLVGLSACGSSKNPVSSNTTTASSSASTTTPATSATTAQSTTTTAAKSTTTAGGGSGSTKADAAFCNAMASESSKLTSASSGLSKLSTATSGKPSKALVNELKLIGQVYTKMASEAPAAIKKDVATAGKQFSLVATAFATGNQQKIIQAAENLNNSGAENDLIDVSTWVEQHCS